MDYINGQNLFELKTALTDTEMKFLIKQAALINKIKIKPSLVYDHWAITNFLEQYAKKEKYLDRQDNKLIAPLVKIFEELSIETLPHCFVHGDITKTNTLKDTNGRLYIIDFAVANYYPRIQELAVLLCDLFFDREYSARYGGDEAGRKRTCPRRRRGIPRLERSGGRGSSFFDPQNPDTSAENYAFVLNEYQKYIKLTSEEVAKLPIYVRLAHAMHVLCATYEKVVNENTSEENNYFLNIGRIGLRCTSGSNL